MESKDNSTNQYEQLLRKHKGLLNITSKIPVRDRSALALVYTPGVGAVCQEIERDDKKAYQLTNKMNSMLIVTDSSCKAEEIKSGKWNNHVLLPFLEATSVYYKTIANIDCYPIIIDYALIKDTNDFAETIIGIAPAYSAVEFLCVDSKRVEEFTDLMGDKKDFAYLGGRCKRTIEKELKDEGINMSASLIYSSVLRAAIDLQCYHNLNECVNHVLKEIKANKEDYKRNDDLYLNLENIVQMAAEYLINLNKITDKNSQDIRNKITSFSIEGKQAWVEEYPNNYLHHKRTNDENSILLHKRYQGMIEVGCKIQFKDPLILNRLMSWKNLDHISNLIKENAEEHQVLTCRSNLAAIITNGTAILGLGDIGAVAGLPVMEGKSVLFKLFGGTDVIPICIQEKDPKKFIRIVQRITPSFNAINLEDIKAPECFEIEATLTGLTPYPVFHDDQHGTAIVVLAAIINSLKLAKKNIGDVKIIMNGAGAAGLSVSELLITSGVKNIIICDTTGAIYTGRENNMNPFKEKLASITNPNKEKGDLKEVLKDSDIFIGLSAPKALTGDMVKTMKEKPIIFALANPVPEIMPDEALEAGAFIVGTGRSDFKNQINNSLAFPGIFRAAIDTRSKEISINMKIAASKAIAGLVKDEDLNPEFIIPDALDSSVPVAVSNSVAKEAIRSGLAQNKNIDQEHVEDGILGWMLEEQLRNWEEISKKNLKYP